MPGKKPTVLEKPAPRPPQPLKLRLPLRGSVRWVLTLLVIGVLGGGGYAVWRHVHETALSGEGYRLDPGDVEITPPPAWIHGDVRGEALRNASLDDGTSILAPDLTERVAEAFAMHPWVAKVQQVRKRHPARVEVDLIYRRPVCMVELPGGGLFPVDADGVVLPTADFTPLEAQQYPRLAGISTLPVGPVGARWGDARVAGGAAVGAALADDWTILELDRIVPLDSASPSATDDYRYDLVTRGGTQIHWGRAPNSETPGDPPAVEKVARLRKHVSEHGTLDGPEGRQLRDLRESKAAAAIHATSGPAAASGEGWRTPDTSGQDD